MSILSDCVPAPNLTAEEVVSLREAADHMDAVYRIIAELEGRLRAAAESERTWMEAHLTDEESNALADQDFGDLQDFVATWDGNTGADPARFAETLRKVVDRCRPTTAAPAA